MVVDIWLLLAKRLVSHFWYLFLMKFSYCIVFCFPSWLASIFWFNPSNWVLSLSKILLKNPYSPALRLVHVLLMAIQIYTLLEFQDSGREDVRIWKQPTPLVLDALPMAEPDLILNNHIGISIKMFYFTVDLDWNNCCFLMGFLIWLSNWPVFCFSILWNFLRTEKLLKTFLPFMKLSSRW